VQSAEGEPVLDIIVPVYNEGANIRMSLESWRQALRYRARVLICYDDEDDDTLTALAGYAASPLELSLVPNQGVGVLGAVVTGFAQSTARCVLMIPADDDYNASRLNEMVRLCLDGYDIVAASRFMQGGRMEGGPPLKVAMVRAAAWFMRYVARVPTHDASNGFRLFSRRVIDRIPIDSCEGFAYSIELLVKAHRLGWRVTEVPVHWYERTAGQSRFKIFGWLPTYLRWLSYAMATTYLRRGPESVTLKGDG